MKIETCIDVKYRKKAKICPKSKKKRERERDAENQQDKRDRSRNLSSEKIPITSSVIIKNST